IELLQCPQVRASGSEVTRGYEPTRTDLSLEAQVPLGNQGVLRVVIDRRYNRIERPRGILRPILSKRHRERIASRIVSPRIIQVHTRNDIPLAGRRCIAQADLEER